MACVVLQLQEGEVVVEVLEDAAPRAAGFFLDHVEKGTYDGCRIYRSTQLGVAEGPRLLQGGPLASVLAPSAEPAAAPVVEPPAIELFETTEESGLRHLTGTLSLARDLLGTGDAIAEWFICLGAFPQLDAGGRSEPDARGFPALGHTTAGLDILGAFARRPTDGRTPVDRLRGEILSEPIPILRAFVR